MKFLITTKELTQEDQELVIKGVAAYMGMFDLDTQVHLEKGSKGVPNTSLESQIQWLLEAIMSLRHDFSAHTALGNPMHKEETK